MARAGLDAGCTLAELTVVIVVVSIAGLVLAAAFREAVRSYELIDLEKDLLQEARYAEQRITREVMRVSPSGGIRAATPTAITLIDRDSATVRFAWDGIKGSDLLYVRNGSAQPLAADVDSLAFGYFDADGRPVRPQASGPPVGLRRVAIFLRLARNGHAVDAVGGAFLRSR